MKKTTYDLVKFISLCIVAVILAALALYTSYTYEGEDLEITFLNVGQGDCAYIKTPDNHRIFIDGGEEHSYDNYLKHFLGKRRIKHINSAVVSHFHSDHAGGILELIDKKRIDTIFVPKTQERTTLIEDKLIEASEKRGIGYIPREIGEIIYDGEDGVKLYARFPDDFIFKNYGKNYNENNDSLVLMLEYAGKKVLFTGDLEMDAEKVLINRLELEADILKVGHHGSKYSTGDSFLDAVNPKYAVISCGLDNSYGFPNPELVQRLNEHKVKIFRTDLDGDITFIIKNTGDILVKTSD